MWPRRRKGKHEKEREPSRVALAINPYVGLGHILASAADSAVASLKETQAALVSIRTNDAPIEMCRTSVQRAWDLYSSQEVSVENNNEIIAWAEIDVVANQIGQPGLWDREPCC